MQQLIVGLLSMAHPKKIEYPEGYVFPNKHWKIIREVEQRKNIRYFLCECMLCGDKYEVSLGSLKRKDSGFCCRACGNAKDLTGRRFGRLVVVRKDAQNNDGQWNYLCKCDCGNEIITRGTSLTGGRTTSCSCYRKEQLSKNHPKGDAHPNWQGGITPQNRIDRGTLSNFINPIIRERDGYTCQNCSTNKSGNFEVHHIFDFATYPELKFEKSNLITLCKTCHDNFHSIYQRKGTNTLDNLESWLEKNYMYRDELLDCYNTMYSNIEEVKQ